VSQRKRDGMAVCARARVCVCVCVYFCVFEQDCMFECAWCARCCCWLRDHKKPHPAARSTHPTPPDPTPLHSTTHHPPPQYHPEASPGPHDADICFEQFVDMMKAEARVTASA
jgi:hypothetical protein